jgi:hypothetical protein
VKKRGAEKEKEEWRFIKIVCKFERGTRYDKDPIVLHGWNSPNFLRNF